MHKREELEKELTYTTIEKMLNKNPNRFFIKHLIAYREVPVEIVERVNDEDEKDISDDEMPLDNSEDSKENVYKDKSIINQTVEEIRENLIDFILQRDIDVKNEKINRKGEKLEPITKIFGFAKIFVNARIVDMISDDAIAKKYYVRYRKLLKYFDSIKDTKLEDEKKKTLDEIQEIKKEMGAYSKIMRGHFADLDAIGSEITNPEQVILTFKQKEILRYCLKKLNKLQQDVIHLFFFEEMTVEEIAEKLHLSKERVRDIKCGALLDMYEILAVQSGYRKRDLFDILLRQQDNQAARLNFDKGLLKELSTENTSTQEVNISMNTAYKEMLLHSINDVAHMMPISDMIDEYLYGRLDVRQRGVFEKHLISCDQCFEDMKQRRKLIFAIKAVLRDMAQ